MKHPDYDRAFHETPEYIRSAIELGFVKGKKAMKMRYKITSALSIAATLVVILGAAAFGASRLGGNPGGMLPAPLSNATATEAPMQLSQTPSPRPAAATPEVTPEPTVEPTPMLEELTPEPTAEAEEMSLETVYYTNAGLYFHVDPTCSGMQNGIEGSVQDAYHDAKEPCPICLADWTFEVRAVPADTASEVTPEPTLEPEAALWESRIVYSAYGVTEYFHRTAACGEQANLRELSVSDAIRENLKPCPSCLNESQYALIAVSAETDSATETGLEYVSSTRQGHYFHSDPNCSGMTGAEPLTLREAIANNQTSCPVCMDGWYYAVVSREYLKEETDYDPTASGKELDLRSIWPEYDINELDTVFATAAGNYFHYDPVCSGMTDAEETVAAIAYLHGKTPCPVCAPTGTNARVEAPEITVAPTMFAAPLNESEEVVEEAESSAESEAFIDRIFYATQNGKYYHSQINCSGMRGATAQSLNVVVSTGKRHCPVCIGDNVESYWLPVPETENDFVFFFWDGGNEPYYHVDPECSGREQVGTTTLGGAKEMGCTPCPVCLRATNAAAAE